MSREENIENTVRAQEPRLSSPFSNSSLRAADTSVNTQETLYAQLVRSATEKRVSFLIGGFGQRVLLTPATIPSLKKFWNQVVVNNHFPAMVKLYLRYSLDRKKTEEFQMLKSIIQYPAMMDFWEEFLKEFDKVRYRLKDQPPDQPDKIHPFNIMTGKFYEAHLGARAPLIDQYLYARVNVAAGHFVKAIEQFTKGLRYYSRATAEDSAAKNKLLEQKEILKEIEQELKGIEVKVKCEKTLNVREKQIYLTAQTAFVEIKKIMEEEVITYQCRDVDEGLQFFDFRAFWTIQTLDDHRLDIMRDEETLFIWDSESLAEKDLIHPDALTTMKRIDARFEKYQNIFIYPSYLLGAHTYHNRAQKYVDLVTVLLHEVDTDMQRKLAQSCGTTEDDELTDCELELLSAIALYRNKVKTLQTQALNYAKAAAELEKTGNYEAITVIIGRPNIKGLLYLESGRQCETLDEFSDQLSKDIEMQWKALCTEYNKKVVVRSSGLEIPAPTFCRQTVNEILERHSAYPVNNRQETPTFG